MTKNTQAPIVTTWKSCDLVHRRMVCPSAVSVVEAVQFHEEDPHGEREGDESRFRRGADRLVLRLRDEAHR